MLEFIARKCTDKFLKKGIIEKEKEAIFIYGFQLLFSTSASIISILLLSIVLKQLELGFAFLLLFIPIRMVAGGFHANTYSQCFLLTNLIFLIFYFTVKKIAATSGVWIIWIMFLASVCYIIRIAPVIHKNHPVNRKRYDKNRKNTYKILIIDLLIMVLFFLLRQYEILNAMAVTVCIVAMMMLVCKKSSSIPLASS